MRSSLFDGDGADDTAVMDQFSEQTPVPMAEPEVAAPEPPEAEPTPEPAGDPEPEPEIGTVDDMLVVDLADTPIQTSHVELIRDESFNFGEELKKQTTAVRLKTSRWGVRKSLTDDQICEVAEEFSAERDTISATKLLIDTKDPRYKAVTSCLGRARAYWVTMTVPYPDEGIRLLRTDRIDEFEGGITYIINELKQAVFELDQAFHEIKERERVRLGELYNSDDYPKSIAGMFKISYEYPSVEPSVHLGDLHPELYAREQERIMARFDEAVKLAEEAFTQELTKAIDHLIDCLAGDVDGKRKNFKASSVNKFQTFAERFKSLNIGSSAELESVVDKVNRIIGGVDPKAIKKSDALRDHIKDEMAKLKDEFKHLLVERPKRRFQLDQVDEVGDE